MSDEQLLKRIAEVLNKSEKNVKLEITGDDFIKMGYKPSRKFSEVLSKLMNMKLDGVVSGRDQELATAKRLFEENK